MNNIEFSNIALNIASNFKTLYVYGCFGAPLNDKAKARYKQAYAYNRRTERATKIDKANDNTFGFDCVCLIKGILWGWNGDPSKIYGGAYYDTKKFPDTNADGIMKECYDISTDFNNIKEGELVHMAGHVGVYIGNGQVVECTPIWKDGVQVTKLSQRKWKNHGKLKIIEYLNLDEKEDKPVQNEPNLEEDIELLTLVRRTIRGDFGNGKNRVLALGDKYSVVQRQVNLNDKHKTMTWDEVKLYED